MTQNTAKQKTNLVQSPLTLGQETIWTYSIECSRAHTEKHRNISTDVLELIVTMPWHPVTTLNIRYQCVLDSYGSVGGDILRLIAIKTESYSDQGWNELR